MRKFQISINLQMFDESEPKSLSVYVDSNNLWETICGAFHELMDGLEAEGYLAGVAREHYRKQE